ncbi:MAG: SpoIID/LytB domain-containing protein [Firmicutes bacterium]|nr:SpoIID/LytB domain-containing protein [Bacillota bacterium]
MVRRSAAFIFAILLILCSALVSFADEEFTWVRVDDSVEPGGAQEPSDQVEDPAVPDDGGEDGEPMWLRIGLKYSSSAVTGSTVSCPDGFILAEVGRYSCEETEDLRDYTELYIKISEGKAAVYDSPEGEELAVLSENDALLSAAEDPDDRIVTIDGSRYRDGVSYKVSGSAMSVINRVTLEHYVLGVVANEMGYQYPAEALKAQAVTARSYAVCNLSRHGSSGFDLCTGQNCQVYKGVSSERETTTAACRQTRNLILTYEGKPAGGFYYAYSSGYTLDSDKVWATQPGYLIGVKDEYASEYIWKANISFESLRARLNSLGYSCGEISEVKVSERTDNGAVMTLTVMSDGGNVKISKSNITGALSYLGVKSQFFYISGTDYPGKESYPIGSAAAFKGPSFEPDDEVYVMGADLEPVKRTASELYVLYGKKIALLFEAEQTGYRDETADSGSLYITGFGYGHSVGMPQVSAKNMAEAGKSFDEILKYYYTGIKVRSLYNQD